MTVALQEQTNTTAPAKKKRPGNPANLTQAGKGRPKGVPNKISTTFRETITNLLQENSANVGVWLARVSEDDPAKALDLLAKLAEYAAPKLSKVEQTSEVNITHGYAFAIERPTRPAIEGELVKPIEQLPNDTPEAATVTAIVKAAKENPL
jgi:hypothetical protein